MAAAALSSRFARSVARRSAMAAAPVPLVNRLAVAAVAPSRSMSFWDGLTSKVEGYRAGQQAKKSGALSSASARACVP